MKVKRLFIFSLIFILAVALSGCLFGSDSDDELDQFSYSFIPEEDYPVRDLSDVSNIWVATEDEEYELEAEKPGKWVGDFELAPGTEYIIAYNKPNDDIFLGNLATIPVAADDLLVAGKEDGEGEVGSFAWAADFDDAVITYNQALRVSEQAEEIEAIFADGPVIDWDGASKSAGEVAEILAARSIKAWSTSYYHIYQDTFFVDASIVVDEKGDWEEYYTLSYNDGWEIKGFESRDAQLVKTIVEDEEYSMEFDLAKAVETNRDFLDYQVEDYEAVVLVGEMNDWDETDVEDYEYSFQAEEDKDSWILEITDESKIEELKANRFKVVGILADAESADDKYHYAPSGFGGQRNLTEWQELTEMIK